MPGVEDRQDGSQAGHVLVVQGDQAVVRPQVRQVPRDRLLEESEPLRLRSGSSRRTSSD